MTLPDPSRVIAAAERIVGYPEASALGRELGDRFEHDPRQLYTSGTIGPTRVFTGPAPGDSDYDEFAETDAFWIPSLGILCLADHIREGDDGWLEWVLRLAGHAALEHPGVCYYSDGRVVSGESEAEALRLAAEAEAFARGFIA